MPAVGPNGLISVPETRGPSENFDETPNKYMPAKYQGYQSPTTDFGIDQTKTAYVARQRSFERMTEMSSTFQVAEKSQKGGLNADLVLPTITSVKIAQDTLGSPKSKKKVSNYSNSKYWNSSQVDDSSKRVNSFRTPQGKNSKKRQMI